MSLTQARTGRARTLAAQSPVTSGPWEEASACRTTDPKLFFSDSKLEREQARAVCRSACPVIAECLSWHRRQEETEGAAAGAYRFGIAGGLMPDQRRALVMEELLGQRPNYAMARRLVSARAVQHLRDLYKARGRSLAGVTETLRQDFGLLVDEVTVRVALWWAGLDGSRVERAAQGDERLMGQRLVDEYADVVMQLRDAGATQYQVAWYLGTYKDAVTQAVRVLEAARAAGEVAA